MDRHLSFSVTEEESGRKIEEFLKTEWLFSSCAHAFEANGPRNHFKWGMGIFEHEAAVRDVLELWIREEEASDQIIPTPLPLNIVYEDEDLMVINKPPDMPIHPSINNHEKTLANAVSIISGKREKLLCTAA